MLKPPMVNSVIFGTSIFAVWITAFENEFIVTFIFMCFESAIVNEDLGTVIVIARKLVDQLVINPLGVFHSLFFQFQMIVNMKFHNLNWFIIFLLEF